jgi:hypothetical protein
MTAVSSVPREPDPERPAVPQPPTVPERPTPAAELKISAEPVARVKVTARRLGSAEGIVPREAARHLIGAFGICICAIGGITGAVLTLRIDPALTTPALAELGLALLSALAIAIGGWGWGRDGTGRKASQRRRN